MMSGICLSVCLSVCLFLAFLDLTRERKGSRSPKSTGWKHITRVSREPIQRSNEVKVTRQINAVTDSAVANTRREAKA